MSKDLTLEITQKDELVFRVLFGKCKNCDPPQLDLERGCLYLQVKSQRMPPLQEEVLFLFNSSSVYTLCISSILSFIFSTIKQFFNNERPGIFVINCRFSIFRVSFQKDTLVVRFIFGYTPPLSKAIGKKWILISNFALSINIAGKLLLWKTTGRTLSMA